MMRPLRGIAFMLIPLFGLVTPLLGLPAVTTRFGADGWAAVAIGQSLGAAVATLVELGWGLNGPQKVARMTPRGTYRAAVLSLRAKLLVLLPTAPVAFTLSWLLAPTHRFDAALVSTGTAIAALSLTWVFLGKTAPGRVIATDNGLRLLGIVAATAGLVAGADLWVYAVVGIALPGTLSPALALFILRREAGRVTARTSRRLLYWTLRAQWHAVSARGVSALYIALPVTLIGIVAPGSVAVFAAGERLMRLGLSAMSIVPSAMQGWIGSSPERGERRRRVRLAVMINATFGAIAAIAFGVAAPLASSLIFTGSATIPSPLAWSFAIVVTLVATSRATGSIALVSIRRIDVIARSASAGALVGVPAILLGGLVLGPVGGVLGEVAAEGTVLAVQARGLLRAGRSA
ncbi:hypothetical protein [Microbacterium sp. 69-10]|uniref:hypothetical protein n=1 Tax=Microbacterium sp. 69-10 TaxID=1895783 RepID=UPI002600CB75|nr:hypothetical protein [Microbacterium sp. 69-10]